jgi:hypothetical protein
MVIVAVSSLPYIIKVGGDMMHYRLVAFPFCLLAFSVAGLFEYWSFETGFVRSSSLRIIIGLVSGTLSFLHYPSFLSEHPIFGRETRILDHGISDAPWHRHHPALVFSSKRKDEDEKRRVEYARMTRRHSAVAEEVFCSSMFEHPAIQYVHGYGLTEPILARINVSEQRPGHKAQLIQLGQQLVQLRKLDPQTKPGLVTRAAQHGRVPYWMLKNRDTISRIEHRVYNRHHVLENLVLALNNPGVIEL